MMKNRRYGRFTISGDWLEKLEDKPEWINIVFNGLIIFRAEHLYHMHAVEYVAYSEYFDLLDVGHIIPKYTLVIEETAEGEIESVEWKRIDE